MSLNKLYLFKNVKITPDYSVVHDMDATTWKNYLLGWLDPMPVDSSPPDILFSDSKVNYYRMPDVIRIEGNYDIIRTATYGLLEDGLAADNPGINTSFKQIFFWVKNVRLLKQFSNRDLLSSPAEYKDVVELEVETDVWSTYAGGFTLYDSFVERRHMPRWKNISGDPDNPNWKPIYYPNAAQGVEGAYQQEAAEDMTPFKQISSSPVTKLDAKYILINVISTAGTLTTYIGMDMMKTVGANPPTYEPVYHVYNTKKIFGLQSVLDGTAFSEMNIQAEKIQSIVVLPYLAAITECLKVMGVSPNEYIGIDETDVLFDDFTITDGTSLSWITLDAGVQRLDTLMLYYYSTPTVIGPDHNVPGYGQYVDKHEPMMYMNPARQRKIVTGMGGTVVDVPDIDAFQSTFTLQNVIDINTAITFVFGGTDVKKANAIGNMGTAEAATLPIYNSAWKSYEAISMVSDTIMYNAKQAQTVGGGIAGAGLSAAGGFLMGGPAGAVIGLAGGIVGTATGVYGNSEELRAKQTQIKNSPATVKSGGSGLGAYVLNYIDVWYETLKLDDVSMEKLRYMYYWFGYHVNRTMKGDIELHTRKVFDYIKTNGAKVRGGIPTDVSKEIAGIFDRGVTIYHGQNGYMEIAASGGLYENDEVEP